MSTFCGRINGCDWISLDHFGGENLSSIVFFLSHCHQDHMKGLADDAFYAHLCEHNCFLYCHPVTKVLLENSPKYTRLLKYIKTKDIDQKFRVTDSLDEVASIQQPADQSTRGLNVTFIDAQHCPGSVMVLLEFDDGKRVLYTGDFRFVKDDWFSCKALRDPKTKSGFKRIDELYFDSTFCRQGSRVFPSRKRSGALFVRMVKEWLDARTHNKVLIWSSSYGQEFLFRKIYEELQMKVHVTMQKFRAYSKIPEIASFVTCVASSTRVHACATVPDVEELEFEEIDQVIVPSCPNSSNNRQKISTCGLCYPDNDTVRVIKPSVIWFARRKEENVIGFERTNFCRLLYSSHCSFEELIDAFTLIRPVRAFPNVVDKRSKKNHEAKIIAFFKRIVSEDSLSSVATEGVRSAECSRSRRSMSCDIFSESDDDHEDVVNLNCASAYSSIGIKRKALSGCDMEQPLFKLDRRGRNERLVHLVSPEADRRLPSLANGCSKEEVELKCSENDVSVINDLTPHLSDSECDPLVCDGRRELSLESDVEEDRSLRLELSQPLSSTQSSDSSVLWE